MANKQAAAPLITGEQALAMREKAKATQSEFWKHLGVTQSGGSRYESGRNIPTPVRLLLALRYGSAAQKRQARVFIGVSDVVEQ